MVSGRLSALAPLRVGASTAGRCVEGTALVKDLRRRTDHVSAYSCSRDCPQGLQL